MSDISIIKSVSQKLFDLFIVDDNKYGRQQDDGSYKLIREKISVVTIDDMLLHQKSLLAYQEYHIVNTALIKWICIDLDIAKKSIDVSKINLENLEWVRKSASDVCNVLQEMGIDFLLEFSGRRGFHIWIIFDELQTKENGYKLVNYLLWKVALQPLVNADKFPKTAGVSKNTKMVGFGVKLPLSQNKGSGRLSYFLENIESFPLNEEDRPAAATGDFLARQLLLLNRYSPMTESQLAPLVSAYDDQIERTMLKGFHFLKAKTIKVFSPENEELENILSALNQCDHLRVILTDYQKGLSGKDRMTLLGLLGRLSSEREPELGRRLLTTFFSNISNFRKDITEERLKLIRHYFPVSCNQLGRCSYCKCTPIDSPVQLINNIEIEPVPAYSISNIDSGLFQKITGALKKYSFINDEIPLYHLFKKLENAAFNEIKEAIGSIYEGHRSSNLESYHFLRNENDKVRSLYAIDHTNNIVSTYFLFILNNIFYTEISDNSFGYSLAPSFNNANIFNNWFINWSQFSRKISHVLKNVEFANYYLVKIDIKSFYDRIDLQRLEIKLYEEASPKIAAKINQLSEEDKIRYKNIVHYLIELARNTTGGDGQGLPQGPAFARYLAELYLLSLDKLIEVELIKDKKREFYYRFVDDIFIFVESESKARNVLKMVDRWASVNSLELNGAKTEIANVAEYEKSGKFQKFQDDAKYMVNKANKNKALLSDIEIQEAMARLDTLTNDAKFGLKDNIRFFYYQFSGDVRLTFIKSRLIKFLPYSNSGRGTLYMMFYADLIKTKPAAFWAIANEQNRLEGLSLGHYLNTILFSEDINDQELAVTANLLDQVSQRTDLSYADKALLITLSRKLNLDLNDHFIQTCPKHLIDSAMATPEIKYVKKDFTYLTDKLRDLDKKSFVHELYIIITQHPLTRELAETLAQYVIKRFSEWGAPGQFSEVAGDSDSVAEYYHCLCFFTLFDTSSESSPLLEAWRILLSSSKTLQIKKPIQFEWLSRAVVYRGNEFARNSYSLLLANKDGSDLNNYECPHGFLRQFQNTLLVLLFSKKDQLQPEDFQADAMSLMDPDSRFGTWLTDHNAILYPDNANICVKNLALNGLIVLQNGNHLFIKKITSDADLGRFDYLPVTYRYKDEEIEIAKNELLTIYLPAAGFKQYLQNLVNFIAKANEFRRLYGMAYPVFYKQPFAVAEMPAVPFYSAFRQKVSSYGTIQENNIVAFWENIEYLSGIRNGAVSLFSEAGHPYNFTVGDLEARFFPKSELIIKTVEDKISFITGFVSLAADRELNNMYAYQDIWSQTTWKLLSEKSHSGSNLTEFLQVHFANFSTADEMPRDILFSVTSRTMVDDSNLSSFLTTIAESFVTFQSQLKQVDFRFSALVYSEKAITDIYLTEKYELSSIHFQRADIQLKTAFNPVSGKSETQLVINSVPITGKAPLLFDREPIGFFAKTADEISIRARGSFSFFAETEQNVLIYIPELELSKTFRRINDRKELLLTNNVNYRKLFPLDEHYKIAADAYEGSDFQKIENSLANHFMEAGLIYERVTTWLTNFTPETVAGSSWKAYLDQNEIEMGKAYRAILQTVAHHEPVSTEAISFFKTELSRIMSSEAIIFPLKHPGRDENGLTRLLIKCGFKSRIVDFEKMARPLFATDCTGKELVILLDTTISGNQAKTAFEHYLTVYTKESFEAREIANRDRYFEFKSLAESETFRKNMQVITDITIVTPILTTAGRTKIENLPVFSGKSIKWLFHEEITQERYLFGAANFDVKNKEIVEQLLLDHTLINRLFIVPDGTNLDTYNNNPKKMNIMLRVGSLPSKHMRLLSLKPQNGSSSLLEYVDNWTA